MVFSNDRCLDNVPTGLIDWVRNVSVKLIRVGIVVVSRRLRTFQTQAALITKIAAHVIFVTAFGAAFGQLAGGHCDEGTTRSFDDL